MAHLERVADDHGKVTAGLPSLFPEKRREITEYHLQRLYQRELQREYRQGEENALASDGSIKDVTDPEQVAGICLPGWVVAMRLTKCARKNGQNLYFKRLNCRPDLTEVYWLKPGEDPDKICNMQTDINTEFALRVVDSEGKVKAQIPGWRRTGMRLIRSGIITLSDFHKMFGPPSRDSENWQRFTQ